MGFFRWFGEQEHRVFDYKPIYYDKEKEELKQKFGKVDGSEEKKKYTPGTYIHGAFRDGNYATKRSSGRAFGLIGVISMILLFIVMYYMIKFYGLL